VKVFDRLIEDKKTAITACRNIHNLVQGQLHHYIKVIYLVFGGYYRIKQTSSRYTGTGIFPGDFALFVVDRTFLKPLLPAEIGQHHDNDTYDHTPDHRIPPLPFQFGHVAEIHAIQANDKR